MASCCNGQHSTVGIKGLQGRPWQPISSSALIKHLFLSGQLAAKERLTRWGPELVYSSGSCPNTLFSWSGCCHGWLLWHIACLETIRSASVWTSDSLQLKVPLQCLSLHTRTSPWMPLTTSAAIWVLLGLMRYTVLAFCCLALQYSTVPKHVVKPSQTHRNEWMNAHS